MPEIAGHYFKEVRKGWTRVEFTDGESLELRREVFSEFGFGNGLTVTADELQQALRESHLRHGRAVALRFLRERPRSTLEVDRRLRRDDLPADAIAAVLEDLSRQGHLNDADFARAWIGSRLDLRPKGIFLIRRELAEKGVAEAVIDAALDRRVLDAMQKNDFDDLTAIPEALYQSGTSETKNWIAAAGILAASGLSMNLIDYIPCYRSEAGTGTAMAFAYWR